jgi:hypothetical protein
LDIHFSVGISCERAEPLAEKYAAARLYVLSLISLHNEHPIYTDTLIHSQTYRELGDVVSLLIFFFQNSESRMQIGILKIAFFDSLPFSYT